MSESPKIFTLKQVVSSIRKTIEERYQNTYWVKAEMHKLNRFPSGHCFPELLQKEEGKIVAQISGSIWSHNFERINKRFIQVVKEPLKDDTTLLMQVKIAFHETYGLSLQILDIDPNYALGELQRERQETLKRLKKEGALNLNQRLHFPLLPKRIAIISAESSKGLSDFMQVIDKNQWGYQFFTMLFPAYLQGDKAADSIVAQLERIDRVKHHFDVVAIIRGGGGEVGLSCYNNYKLCNAIARFKLPVLTGVGHSTNLTVAEMISHRNAITPTELADFFIQSFHEFSVPIHDAMKSIKVGAERLLLTAKQELSNESKHYKRSVLSRLEKDQFELRDITKSIQSSTRLQLNSNKEKVLSFSRRVNRGGTFFLNQKGAKVEELGRRMQLSIQSYLTSEKSNVQQLEQSIRLMDPINVLKRGYSISTVNGKLIDKNESIKEGDTIITRTAKFTLESEISSIQKTEKE